MGFVACNKLDGLYKTKGAILTVKRRESQGETLGTWNVITKRYEQFTGRVARRT